MLEFLREIANCSLNMSRGVPILQRLLVDTDLHRRRTEALPVTGIRLTVAILVTAAISVCSVTI